MKAATEEKRNTAYIARETIVSAAINGAISAFFFWMMFGAAGPVSVREGGYAIDFLPQSAAVALMACMVPGLIARRAQLAGRFGIKGYGPAPLQWVLRVTLVSILFALLLAAAVAALWLTSGVAMLNWVAALCVKAIYGAALGGSVTRRILQRMLCPFPSN